MKIINKTHWRTEDLRKFIARIAGDELDPAKRRVVTVRIEYRRKRVSRYCTGHAWIKGRNCVVRVPGTDSKMWRHDFCVVVAHELAHLRGAQGERWMRKTVRYGRPDKPEEIERQRAFYAWGQEIEIRSTRDKVPEPEPQPAPEPEPQPEPVQPAVPAFVQKRVDKTAAKLAEWERRLKTARRKVQEYRRKQRYYARKGLAASPAK